MISTIGVVVMLVKDVEKQVDVELKVFSSIPVAHAYIGNKYNIFVKPNTPSSGIRRNGLYTYKRRKQDIHSITLYREKVIRGKYANMSKL